MSSGTSVDISSTGKRLRQRVMLALALASAMPLLVLVYVVHEYVLPVIDPTDTVTFFGLQTLMFFTLLAMVTGGFIIWNLGRTVTSLTRRMSQDPNLVQLESKSDEVGALMSNFSKMFETIETQANEINNFATRLDAAYKELESTNAKLKDASFKDEVTGLYNRRFFSIRLEEEISRHRRFNHPVSIVLLDLDGFKAVNDELGHEVGDRALVEVAERLRLAVRSQDAIARWGGEEMLILLVETSKAGARLYAERIRDMIAKFRFGHGKPVTASLGVASLPDDDVATAEEIFKMADEGLYAAKRAGRNQVGRLDGAPAPEA